jgi:DNA-binding LacI/PurR family transcriptional regulator
MTFRTDSPDPMFIRRVAALAVADVRTVKRELHHPGSVAGRVGERVRTALRAMALVTPPPAPDHRGLPTDRPLL